MSKKSPAPVLFVDHGSPMNAIEEGSLTRALARAADSLGTPEAVVAVSAHWETEGGIGVAASAAPPTIHDFGGFPDALYRIRYPAPGDPTLARRIVRLLHEAGLAAAEDPDQGLDHGTWVPLARLLPEARVPVVQVSLPTPMGPAGALAMGRALAGLRERGALLLASGGIVHHLGVWGRHADQAYASATRAFETWIHDRLGGPEALLRDLAGAPGLAESVPTPEHFLPLFFALGAVAPGDRLEVLARGFDSPALSADVFAWHEEA